MRNPEYKKPEGRSETEASFSEKELDLDIEIRAGEWQNLKKFKAYQQRSRQGKIIATYQAVSNRLNQLVSLYYKFVNINPSKAEKMLEELRYLRYIQDVLMNCLVWSRGARSGSAREPQGQLEKSKVPEEVWNLIK